MSLDETAEVIVIGAGVVGCSIAYYLAHSGANVLLLERDSIGSGASGHATGSLSVLGSEFSNGASFELALAGYREFIELVPRLEFETDSELLYQRRPSLRLAIDDEEVTLIKDMMVWQSHYVDIKWIVGSEVRRIEPRLSPKIQGAVFEEESAQLDSYRFNIALARGAEYYGAKLALRNVTGLLKQNSRVIGVRTEQGNMFADMVVVAAGASASLFGNWLDFPVPVKPLKGERLMLRYHGSPLPVLISSPMRGHMISRMDGLLSVGSTGGRDYDQDTIFSMKETDAQPTKAAQMELLRRAIDVFPGLREAELVQQLAGTRPLSPDRMPIIGPIPGWDGIILATGHTTKGIHLGPITGKIIRDIIFAQCVEKRLNISLFRPDRFAHGPKIDFRFDDYQIEE